MYFTFLFLLLSSFGSNQVPVVSNYDDFLNAVDADKAIALNMDFEGNQYGEVVNNRVYQEVLPINDEYQFLFSEVFETRLHGAAPEGESYVCLCKKKDLVVILKRWRDGQHGIQDYEKFDCKHRSFYKKDNLYAGLSFWGEVNIMDKLATQATNVDETLAGKAKIVVFKNRTDGLKKIIKVKLDMPIDSVVKVLEDETYLVSVKGKAGDELYLNEFPAFGWKRFFPDWFAYRPLNNGFWSAPSVKNPIYDGQFSKTYSLTANVVKPLTVKGQATFLVKTGSQKQKTISLALGSEQRIIKKSTYLDYGSVLKYGITSLIHSKERMILAFESNLPLASVMVLNELTGERLALADTAPFECVIPMSTKRIKVEVSYAALKKIRVKYSN